MIQNNNKMTDSKPSGHAVCHNNEYRILDWNCNKW